MYKKNNYKILLFQVLIVVITISCKETKQNYFYFNFNEEELKHFIVAGDIKNQKENGFWSVYNAKDSLLLTQGNYFYGLKTGQWIYNLSNNNIDTVSWNIINDKHKQLLINLPKDWTVLKYDEFFFISTFKSNSPISKTKYFVILKNSIDSLNFDFESYYKDYQLIVKSSFEVSSQKNFLIKSEDKIYYFSVYSVIKEGEPILLLNLLTNIDNQIFDITYSSLEGNNELKKNIFIDIVKGCYINNVRILDPFKTITVSEINK